MEEPLKIAIVLLYGYLLGSLNAAYVVGRALKDVDLRKVGSGTVGAANVWHNVGKLWIFPVGAFDLFVKGFTPVVLARSLLDLDLEWQVVGGLMAIVGHNWSAFLGLQGGRGVAPTIGVLVALARIELTLFIVVSVVGWRLMGNSAIWVLVSFALLPLWSLLLDRPASTVLLMGGILTITVVKRLVSNKLRGSGVRYPRLMWNRLVFDRDIDDPSSWMRQGRHANEGGPRA
jgi:glycerol-3-phosphate acyltransferase PlsY